MIVARMNATGIGFAGLDGAWWLPAVEPFRLPPGIGEDLAAAGPALFTLVDAVWEELRAVPDGPLARRLAYKVPPDIARHLTLERVDSFRPDFQLVATGNPDHPYRPVLTEIEIAPATQGFAHAMQVGYDLETDLADVFAAYLGGRRLIFAGTEQWAEFIFEQLAFCQALSKRGAGGQVVYERPLDVLEAEARCGDRWVPPMNGVAVKPPGWNLDLRGRLKRHGQEALWLDEWPAEVGDAVVFRFGYIENFGTAALERFACWHAAGATFLNPLAYPLDSKVLLTAVRDPAIRARLAPETCATLDATVPETILLDDTTLPRLTAEREAWLIKYAGFDGDNMAWGGRSVQMGFQYDDQQWARRLAEAAALPWPVVGQRLAPTARFDAAYLRPDGSRGVLRDGFSRLRVFFLRGFAPAGAHLTLTRGTMRVSEATDTVQGPVVFK